MKHLMTLAALFVSTAAVAQIPTLPWNPDGNGDGLIGSSDLIELLTVYGEEFQNLILSENEESAIMVANENFGYHRCQFYCENLPGSWKMAAEKDLVPIIDSLVQFYEGIAFLPSPFERIWIEAEDLVVESYEVDSISDTHKLYPYMELSIYSWTPYGFPARVKFVNQSAPFIDGYPGNPGYPTFELNPLCACTIKQLPRVEYSACADVINNPGCANQLVSDGWYPMGSVSDSGTQAFWRYAQ